MKGLSTLQQHLDADTLPDDWPDDVCRDAFCGYWQRNNGYVWHRPEEHGEWETGKPSLLLGESHVDDPVPEDGL